MNELLFSPPFRNINIIVIVIITYLLQRAICGTSADKHFCLLFFPTFRTFFRSLLLRMFFLLRTFSPVSVSDFTVPGIVLWQHSPKSAVVFGGTCFTLVAHFTFATDSGGFLALRAIVFLFRSVSVCFYPFLGGMGKIITCLQFLSLVPSSMGETKKTWQKVQFHTAHRLCINVFSMARARLSYPLETWEQVDEIHLLLRSSRSGAFKDAKEGRVKKRVPSTTTTTTSAVASVLGKSVTQARRKNMKRTFRLPFGNCFNCVWPLLGMVSSSHSGEMFMRKRNSMNVVLSRVKWTLWRSIRSAWERTQTHTLKLSLKHCHLISLHRFEFMVHPYVAFPGSFVGFCVVFSSTHFYSYLGYTKFLFFFEHFTEHQKRMTNTTLTAAGTRYVFLRKHSPRNT